MTNRLAIALVHYPVVDRNDKIYTTAITNLDVHDIARSARTYSLNKYYIVTPISAQQELAHTIATFWLTGGGTTRSRDRGSAMELVDVKTDLQSAIDEEIAITGKKPILIATSAKVCEKKSISYEQGKKIIADNQSTIVIFGTGYGLAPSIVDNADFLLEPIYGPDHYYNHLSVRSAAAIILDRLCGR